MIKNNVVEDYARLATNHLNEFHTVVGGDHTNFIFDENYGSQTIRSSINFLDKVVKDRENEAAYRDL